jgi:hypothetical protein
MSSVDADLMETWKRRAKAQAVSERVVDVDDAVACGILAGWRGLSIELTISAYARRERRTRRREQLVADELRHLDSGVTNPDAAFVMLATLEGGELAAALLVMSDLSYREAARILGVSKSTIARAVGKIRFS